MDTSVSHRTQFRGMADEKNIASNICGARINNEMSYAIRRQREISGVDYFKQAAQTKIYPQSDKKGFSNRLQSVNFDGRNLPQFSISSQIKTDRNPSRHVGKNGKFGSLNRSKSSASLSLPTGRTSTQVQNGLHNVVVTDLTCLQLADTLFSSNISTSLKLSSQTAEKLKYTHFNGDRKNPLSSENDNFYINFKNGTTSCTPLPLLASRTRPESGNNNRRQRPESPSKTKNENKRPNSAGGTKKVSAVAVQTEKDTTSPKSILKQNNVETQTDDCWKRTKYRTLSDKIPKKNSCLDQSKYFTIKASKIGIQCQNSPTLKTCAIDFEEKDKRSVRFNVSHEIFEYAPHEPVWN